MSEKNYGGHALEEILQSLKVIQSICEKNYDRAARSCSDTCPFINKYDTGFRQKCEIIQPFPYQWKLKECPPNTWTPFEQTT